MDLFNQEEIKIKLDEDVKVVNNKVEKMNTFAEVNEAKDKIQLDFVVDSEALSEVNKQFFSATPERKFAEKESMESAESSIRNTKMTESDNLLEEDNAQSIKAPVDKLDFLLDTMDEYGDKTMKKVGDIAKRGVSYLKKQIPRWLSNYQDKKIHRKFENGALVKTDDFEFFLFQNELMVYRYTGTSLHVVIPDYVGNLPVKYVYRGFLNKNIFDNYKVRSFVSYFKDDNIQSLSIDALKDSLSGIKSLQLPKELSYIPMNLFSGMKNMKVLIVPASVQLISPSAFIKSSLKDVYFRGPAPKNLRLMDLPDGVTLYCTEEFVNTYKVELEGRAA